KMTVFLQHRTTAAGVVDDRVNVVELSAVFVGVLVRELLRGSGQAGVMMQGTTTHLASRYPHFAAVLLQDTCRRQCRLGKEGIGRTADEERDARPSRSLGGQDLGQLAVVRLQSWHNVLHPSQRRGQQSPETSHYSVETDLLQ